MGSLGEEARAVRACWAKPQKPQTDLLGAMKFENDRRKAGKIWTIA